MKGAETDKGQLLEDTACKAGTISQFQLSIQIIDVTIRIRVVVIIIIFHHF